MSTQYTPTCRILWPHLYDFVYIFATNPVGFTSKVLPSTSPIPASYAPMLIPMGNTHLCSDLMACSCLLVSICHYLERESVSSGEGGACVLHCWPITCDRAWHTLMPKPKYLSFTARLSEGILFSSLLNTDLSLVASFPFYNLTDETMWPLTTFVWITDFVCVPCTSILSHTQQLTKVEIYTAVISLLCHCPDDKSLLSSNFKSFLFNDNWCCQHWPLVPF